MLVLTLSAAAAAVPPADAAWAILQQTPVRVECVELPSGPWCRSNGIVAAPTATVVQSLKDMRSNGDKFESIVQIDVLAPDTLRVVLDFPPILSDRDYVARYSQRTEADGVEVFAWESVVHQKAPPVDGIVRLVDYAGEWRLKAAGERTAVTYIWQADLRGSVPSWVNGVARKKAGHEALKDLAKVNGATLHAPSR